jgi:hypothetical protein
MPDGNAGVNGVKVGEPFQVVLMATPSEGFLQARLPHLYEATCRDETAPS